jgi:hypothetical protein
VSHASSVLWPPVLTFSLPRPSVAAPQDTWDPSTTSALPDTNHVAHILTQKTCIANHNKICPKVVQEDTVDDSVSSTPRPSHDNLASLSLYRRRTHTNSILDKLSQQSNPVVSSNVSPTFPSSFHKPFSCQASLLSFRPHQEIPHGHQTPPNRNTLYVVDKDIFQAINNK